MWIPVRTPQLVTEPAKLDRIASAEAVTRRLGYRGEHYARRPCHGVLSIAASRPWLFGICRLSKLNEAHVPHFHVRALFSQTEQSIMSIARSPRFASPASIAAMIMTRLLRDFPGRRSMRPVRKIAAAPMQATSDRIAISPSRDSAYARRPKGPQHGRRCRRQLDNHPEVWRAAVDGDHKAR